MGNSAFDGYDIHPAPIRPAKNDHLAEDITWQYEENPQSVINAINEYQKGDHELAIRRLCYGQRHNGDVCNDYKTFRQDALNTMMDLYGNGVRTQQKFDPIRSMPFVCQCGHIFAHCSGNRKGQTCIYVDGPPDSLICPVSNCRVNYGRLGHTHI